MPACAFTSNHRSTFSECCPRRLTLVDYLVLVICFLLPIASFAATAAGDPAPAATSSSGKTDVSEEEDFSKTPFTEYGNFNSDADEAEDTKFYQYGRFFGVSIGAGYEGATGNRGLLYSGGFPMFELKVHYWFDFNLALTLDVAESDHYFNGQLPSQRLITRNDLNFFKFGADLRYYFDTKNLTASLSYANPFVVMGVSSYSRRQSTADNPDGATTEGAVGFNLGAGMQFAIRPKKTYFDLEAKFHVVNFKDNDQPVILSAGGNKLPDSSGMFFTVLASFLFTW